MKKLIIITSLLTCLVGCSQSAEDLYQKGINYYDGINGVEQNKEKGLSLLKKSAGKGYDRAYYLLGVIAMKDQKMEECVVNYDKALELGESANAKMLGNSFYYGLNGFPEDDALAARYYLKAVDLNAADNEVYLNLGILFYNGNGVDLDYGKAATCFQRAADMDDPTALYNLAICYYNGKGVAVNRDMAMECVRRSAELGNKDAQNYLDALRQEEYERQLRQEQAMQEAIDNQIITCPSCHGYGRVQGTGFHSGGTMTCSLCQGAGQVTYGYARRYGFIN